MDSSARRDRRVALRRYRCLIILLKRVSSSREQVRLQRGSTTKAYSDIGIDIGRQESRKKDNRWAKDQDFRKFALDDSCVCGCHPFIINAHQEEEKMMIFFFGRVGKMTC